MVFVERRRQRALRLASPNDLTYCLSYRRLPRRYFLVSHVPGFYPMVIGQRVDLHLLASDPAGQFSNDGAVRRTHGGAAEQRRIPMFQFAKLIGYAT